MRNHVNLGTTSLTYAIDSVATTVFVEDASVLPSSVPFDLRINQGGLDEFVRVTAVAGNQLTVVRGSEGGRFTARDHLPGVPVRQVLTASAIAELTTSSGNGTSATEIGPLVCLRRAFVAGGPTTIAITTDSYRVLGWELLVTTPVSASTCTFAGVSVSSAASGRFHAGLSATLESTGTMNFVKSDAGIAGEVLVYGFRR